jgi:peptidoglycan/LPS O-acetylase OafA/YrhL
MIDQSDRPGMADHSLPALTGLRGLAALWVLMYHAWVYVTPQEILLDLFGEPIQVHVFFSLGWAGVHLLFVLSGFLLTLPFARANAGMSSRPRIARYLLRRVARVFPAYYLQLFLLVVITLLTSGLLLVNPTNAIQYLLMLFVPPPVGIGAPASVNGVWWTLPIELSFYLVLPLIAWLADRRRKLLLVAVSLLSMVVWRYFVLTVIQPVNEPSVWLYQLPGSMDTFGLGMLGAVLHVQYSNGCEGFAGYTKRLTALLWATPVLFVLLGMWMANEYASYWSGALISYLWTPLFGAAVLIVILNCAQNRMLLNRALGNRLVFYLGTVSYGVYLWHPPIGVWLLGLPLIADMQTYQFPRLVLLMFVGSVAAASLSWFLVEAKVIAMARRM